MDKLLVVGQGLANDAELRRVAEHSGYAVLSVAGRNDALVALRAEQPSVALVLHELPDDDGVEVLKELRRADPCCEVVLATQGGEMDVAIEVLRAGALDYLRTPIDAEALRVALRRARERNPRPRPSTPQTILVVEDHDATRKQMVNVLAKEGYRVLGAANGEEALRCFADHHVDLIISDLMMPGKSGLDVLQETKGAGGDVEVIVATGHRDESVVVSALRQGAINFLKKPVEIEHLLLAIQRAFEHQTLRRTLASRNRDLELMQSLVLRLTHEMEVVVEKPRELSTATFGFLHQLVDTLPFGVVVINHDQAVTFANSHVLEKTGPAPKRISAQWLKPAGLGEISETELAGAIERTLSSRPGHVETLLITKWAFLLLTPLRVLTPSFDQRFVAIAIRGERQAATPSAAAE